MNRTKVTIESEENNENNFSAMMAEIMPRQNGSPEKLEALASAFRRNGIHAEYNAELQENLNKKCLPNPSKLRNTFKKASIVLLFLGLSFSAMAQTPSPKTDIIVTSKGKSVNLTVSDTTYLNGKNNSIRLAINNFKSGGVIKNNDMAEMILTFLNNRK